MGDVFNRYSEALSRGHKLAAGGRFKDALQHYEIAAQLAGQRARPHLAIGSMQLRLGRARKALAAYEHALALEPDDLDALSGRAAALLALGRRAQASEVADRIERLRAGPDADPPLGSEVPLDGAEFLHAAGETARRMGRTEAAIDAWLAEGRAHASAGHHDAALEACLRALSLSVGAPRVHLEMARIYFERDWRALAEERIALLDRLLELQPNAELRVALRQLAQDNGAGGALTAA